MNQPDIAVQHRDADAVAAEDLSAMLMALYQAARQPSVHEFQRQAVERLREQVPFDSVLWGTGTLLEGRTHVHCAYVANMPVGAVDLLNLTEQQNVVARTCRAEPGRAHRFPATLLFANEQTALLARYQGIRQVCCIASVDPSASLVGFLSVARQQDEPAFGARDSAWLELLMPHLTTMLNLTRVAQMVQIREARASSHSRLAVTDVKGVLHVMEPGFDALLREEWPGWQGPLLPAALVGTSNLPRPQAALPRPPEGVEEPGRARFPQEPPWRYHGRWVTGESAGAAEQLLVTLTRKGPADRLTPQERATATAYARGCSYKEVARELGLAPATVRHHLREVYAKLGVRDKAALTGVLQQGRHE